MLRNRPKTFYNVVSEINPRHLSGGKIGIEKECLRINDSIISQKKHHHKLGSSLCNKYITTDFSESLLEFVTPPSKDNIENFNFLEDIHDFVLSNIGDEFFWPFSMPLMINSEGEIPIAEYGVSNYAILKRIYREGLAIRYGRHMQAISGVHFNYSLNDNIWESGIFSEKLKGSSKSEIYVGCLRNLKRFNWIILYLFGASPVIPKSLIKDRNNEFITLDDDYFYLPDATSLRMSDIGYQSEKQSSLLISYNSLNDYIFDLKRATETFSENFHMMGKNTQDGLEQLSSSILQIEDEYYSVARPKSSLHSEERMLSKLKNNGIDYLEFRSLDLNPFARSGIDIETVYFLEVFLLYCCILDSSILTKDEAEEIKMNDLIVSRKGRDKKLSLYKDKKPVELSEWAASIIEDMMVIAEILDNDENNYIDSIHQAQNKITSPENTPSARILDKMLTDGFKYEEFGFSRGIENKKSFVNYQNQSMKLLKDEARLSFERQQEIESNKQKPFDIYLKEYLENI